MEVLDEARQPVLSAVAGLAGYLGRWLRIFVVQVKARRWAHSRPVRANRRLRRRYSPLPLLPLVNRRLVQFQTERWPAILKIWTSNKGIVEAICRCWTCRTNWHVRKDLRQEMRQAHSSRSSGE
jgi:hypothetical protein